MIWNQKENPESTLSETPSVRVCVEGERRPVADETVLREVALAINAFLRAPGGRVIADDQELAVLACRALASLGEKHAAGEILTFGTGLVSRTDWKVAPEGEAWVLNLDKIRITSDMQLEFFLFSALHVILDSLAPVWDVSCGRGMLGLRRLNSTASTILGVSGKKAGKSDLPREIKDVCRRKLNILSRKRRWRCIPEIIDLDGV
ncbi:MAG: hypothetical protein R6V03_00640 [Kiritimatiellia bacterium]